MIGREHRECAVRETQPDCLVIVGGVARRRRADTLCAFEVRLVEVVPREEEVLRAGLGVDGEASRLGVPQVGGGTGRGDVHDEAGRKRSEQGHPYSLGMSTYIGASINSANDIALFVASVSTI